MKSLVSAGTTQFDKNDSLTHTHKYYNIFTTSRMKNKNQIIHGSEEKFRWLKHFSWVVFPKPSNPTLHSPPQLRLSNIFLSINVFLDFLGVCESWNVCDVTHIFPLKNILKVEYWVTSKTKQIKHYKLNLHFEQECTHLRPSQYPKNFESGSELDSSISLKLNIEIREKLKWGDLGCKKICTKKQQ